MASKEERPKRSRAKDFFTMNGIPLPVTDDNGYYYTNGIRREECKFD